jgi:hypothetical protein
MDGDWADAENLSVTETRPECWGAGDFVFDEDEAWRSHFFYGGACDACDGCVASGMCVPVGAVDPKNPCVLCAAAETWANNDGVVCDDGAFCNGDDSCLAGSCAEHNGDPCAEGGRCIEESDSCDAPDPDDDAGDPVDPDDDDGASDDQEDADRSGCGC